MRIVRYKYKEEAPSYGWLLEDKVGPVSGNVYGDYSRQEAELTLASVRLLAPAEPSKIICIGRNFAEHAREHDAEVPKVPLIFMKPPSSIIGPGEAILLPPQSQQVEHEAELVVVMGKRGKNILTEEAQDHIFGYTVGNDVTARDLQRSDGQ